MAQIDVSKSLPLLSDIERKGFMAQALITMGPGLMVMFADTDGPCLLTAAQSGAQYTYSLLLLQIVLIPVLFFAQDLTVRLGLIYGKGVVALIKAETNELVGWSVAIPLLISCMVGLISEYIVIGQMLLMWGVPVYITNSFVTFILMAIVLTGSYCVAERVGLMMGACQVLLFITTFTAGAKAGELWEGLGTFHWSDANYNKLVTANIGAVIMPWMLAYQQSAVCNKGLHKDGGAKEHLFIEQVDTFIGSILTQGVMAAMLVTIAAAKGRMTSVDSVNDVLLIFTDIIGNEFSAKIFLSFAFIGASMVAAIVQTLCAAWVFEESMGRMPDPRKVHNNVCERVNERPVYYGMYMLTCMFAFIFTILTDNAVDLSVLAEFINGILMPPVVFVLWYLCSYKLPKEHRLGRFYKYTTFVLFFICSLFCLLSIPTLFEEKSP